MSPVYNSHTYDIDQIGGDLIAVTESHYSYFNRLTNLVVHEGRKRSASADLVQSFRIHMGQVAPGKVWEDELTVRLDFGGMFDLIELLEYVILERQRFRTVSHSHHSHYSACQSQPARMGLMLD